MLSLTLPRPRDEAVAIPRWPLYCEEGRLLKCVYDSKKEAVEP